MTNPKTNSFLDEANRLFLQGKFREAISYYDKILNEIPDHISSLNNKGYALSKLKDYDNAIDCYDIALQLSPNDISVLVNKISSLRKQGHFKKALTSCDKILENNPSIILPCITKSEYYFLWGDLMIHFFVVRKY